ncbi:hypothetical protein [Methanofollis tationis]|uniref:Uncharacterized protein n=1 Tax=Methanofollis tationis TaxID=81417 RepID=A0A7K4HND3_9EURY|nr:hypothetical protein [Methanofollis tationis]NVO66786.1 hypothetical protein [Methanofollis tationis]
MIILVGISLLLLAAHGALAAAGSTTFAAPWTPEAEDGTFVAVRGTVDGLRHLTGGHLSVTVGGATVFIPARVSDRICLEKGLNVSIAGTVQTYRGEKEIVVQFPGDVAVT